MNFALSLIHKDFSLVLSRAYDLYVAMSATAADQQMHTAAMAKGMDEDFSIMIQFMKELVGLSTTRKNERGNSVTIVMDINSALYNPNSDNHRLL